MGILIGLTDQIFAIVRTPRRLNEDDIAQLKDVYPLFIEYWKRLFAEEDGKFKSIPHKVHWGPAHMVQFIERFFFVGLGDESAGEHDHHIDLVDSRVTHATNHNFKAQQEFNYSRRKLRYNPDQLAEMKRAIEQTARGPKRSSTEKNEEKASVKKEKRTDNIVNAKSAL